LIIARRTLTVAKTAFAGVMLEIFSARSMASMAAFNKETALSRPFGRWDSVAMVETQGSWEETVGEQAVRKNQKPSKDGRSSCHVCPVQSFVRKALKRWFAYWTPMRRSVDSPLPSDLALSIGGAFPKRPLATHPLLSHRASSGASDPSPRTRFRARTDSSLDRIRRLLSHLRTYRWLTCHIAGTNSTLPNFRWPIQQSTSLIHTRLY